MPKARAHVMTTQLGLRAPDVAVVRTAVGWVRRKWLAKRESRVPRSLARHDMWPFDTRGCGQSYTGAMIATVVIATPAKTSGLFAWSVSSASVGRSSGISSRPTARSTVKATGHSRSGEERHGRTDIAPCSAINDGGDYRGASSEGAPGSSCSPFLETRPPCRDVQLMLRGAASL